MSCTVVYNVHFLEHSPTQFEEFTFISKGAAVSISKTYLLHYVDNETLEEIFYQCTMHRLVSSLKIIIILNKKPSNHKKTSQYRNIFDIARI